MDRELRALELKYRRWGDYDSYSEWLALGLRLQRVELDKVLAAAFLKDGRARYFGRSCNLVKPRGVILEDRLLPNIETMEIVRNLRYWKSPDLEFRAALGVLQYIASMSESFTEANAKRMCEIITSVEDIVLHNEPAQIGRLMFGHRHERGRQYTRQQGQTHAYNLRVCFHNITHRIQIKRSPLPSLINCAILFNDSEFLTAISRHVIPWALGEFQ